MSEKTRTKLIAVFLVGAIIWAGLNYKSNETTLTEAPALTVQPIDQGLYVRKQSTNLIDVKAFDTLSWGRSPFYLKRFTSIKKAKIEKLDNSKLSWILSGIIFNNSSPTAIINKRPVKIGDKIDKAIVTQIDKNKVIIKYKQKNITLKVSKG